MHLTVAALSHRDSSFLITDAALKILLGKLYIDQKKKKKLFIK